MLNISSSKSEASHKIYQGRNQTVKLDSMTLPWKSEPSPLVSLLDMLKIFPEDFHIFMRELEELADDHELFDFERPGLTHFEVARIDELIDKASNWCKLIEVSDASRIISHIKDRILTSGYGWMNEPHPLLELGELIRMLQNIIKQELSTRLFFYIPKDQAGWYEKKDGFGVPVANAFRSAIKDIKGAGTCYATGLYNASVFHSMRVLEYGLNALAKEVGVIIKRESWATIIKDIEKAIQAETKRERKELLSQAALQFRFFKDAWRNHVSHNRGDYDGLQALSVLNHVSTFMEHLATKLKLKE